MDGVAGVVVVCHSQQYPTSPSDKDCAVNFIEGILKKPLEGPSHYIYVKQI
jgi:hypothetical protein